MRRKLEVLAAALCATALAGCLDLGLLSSIAFPPDIPGLDRDQPWVRLPVSSWVTTSGPKPAPLSQNSLMMSPSCRFRL